MNIKVVKEILKAQSRVFILILSLLVLNIALFMFSFIYQNPRLENLQNQWFEKRKLATGGSVADAATIYQQGIKDLKIWRDRILPKKGFARFVGTLYETTANNSLSFKGVTYKVIQIKEQGLAAYTLNFNVVGKYAAVKSFISDLQRMPEIFAMENLSLNNNNSIEDAVDLKVQLTVYLRMEE
jgi:type IV pilus assembly protein PilO